MVCTSFSVSSTEPCLTQSSGSFMVTHTTLVQPHPARLSSAHAPMRALPRL